MSKKPMNLRTNLSILLLIGASMAAAASAAHAAQRLVGSESGAATVEHADPEVKKYLYVAVPRPRRYLEHGGHGLLVFDIEDNYRFVKRIPVKRLLRKDMPDLHGGVTPAGEPSNVPPVYKESVKLRKQPGWITFSLDGAHAYAPTGEIIDVETKEVVAQLVDETGALIKSEKMLEIHLSPDGRAVRASDQFGIGQSNERH
jgi:hypothetical protein